MRFGIHFHPEVVDFSTIRDLCQRAEKTNYELFTITDHFLNMENPKGLENHPLESWTTLAALSALTDKIQLGTLVSCAHYRQPTVLAKMATTVDVISKGRLIFGIGAGWYRDEFESFLGNFPTAKKRITGLEEAVQICKSMFENVNTTFTGSLYSARNTLNLPKPVRGRIPIMVGGAGEKTLRIMAKYADIAHVWDHFLPSELGQRLQSLRKHCDDVRRSPKDLIVATGLNVILTPKVEVVRAETKRIASMRKISLIEAEHIVNKTVGSENILETIRQCRDLGVTLITLVGLEFDELGKFQDEVGSKLND
ncbi:MAG TPA: LLM class flavin-dependent oxidoreductase [Candidatus Saccharimonadales bacterium]|nr:LLM class flavin-dependent oxidoreductase [Candidatus Saccharimonadales bacterium]